MNMAEKVGEWRTGMVVGFAEVVDADVRKLFHDAVEGRHRVCAALVIHLFQQSSDDHDRDCCRNGRESHLRSRTNLRNITRYVVPTRDDLLGSHQGTRTTELVVRYHHT